MSANIIKNIKEDQKPFGVKYYSVFFLCFVVYDIISFLVKKYLLGI